MTAYPVPSASAHPVGSHALASMLRDLVALQALAAAGGLRSAHRDPRESAGHTTGGRAIPEATPLERACDSGELARARVASAVLARVGGPERATLLWLADRAHAGDGDWPRYLAAELAPLAMRERATRAAERATVAASQRAALRAALARGSRRVSAESLRDAGAVAEARSRAEAGYASARAAAALAELALRAWGEARLAACVCAWARAGAEVRGDGETDGPEHAGGERWGC